MIVYIKNMVCDRCKSVVAAELTDLNLEPRAVELGAVHFGPGVPTVDQLKQLRHRLEPLGFEIIDDKTSLIIEGIKKHVIDLVHRGDEPGRIRLSDYLKQNLHYDYSYLSGLFSAVEGVTIEKYLIQQKIERVKELLVYGEMNLTEIAHCMNYSSLAHLSAQFKKVTGLTPSHFRNLRDARARRPLDRV